MRDGGMAFICNGFHAAVNVSIEFSHQIYKLTHSLTTHKQQIRFVLD